MITLKLNRVCLKMKLSSSIVKTEATDVFLLNQDKRFLPKLMINAERFNYAGNCIKISTHSGMFIFARNLK